MPTFDATITLGNIATIICIVFAAGISWGNIDKSFSELKLLREQDMNRIVRVETSHEILKQKVDSLEKQNTEIYVTLKYIRESVDEIRSDFKNAGKK